MNHDFSIFVGFDGFIDHIFTAVDQRFGPGNNFQKIKKIQQFAERISNASGKSTNIELFPIEQRIGGNGPILAQTLAFYGAQVQLMGALGNPLNSIFQRLSPEINPISIGNPGTTNAIEFEDGKLLLGITHPLDHIKLENILPYIKKNSEKIFACNAFCFTNWTMVVHLDEILTFFGDHIREDHQKFCFFDLADPEKRSADDIYNVLQLIQLYSQKCTTILGLNLKEAEQIAVVLQNHQSTQNNVNFKQCDIKELCQFIQAQTKIDEVVIHDTAHCAAATPSNIAYVDGFFVEHPKTTTGAGDHFNAGYLLAKLQKKSLHNCLSQAHEIAGHFVATGTCLRAPRP
ncbi:MAG: carbohydrate kinase family protein [Puniceicoccales bacterium]|jgi:sugar/nucleoside kinase (ribokinase family)|nr:carbohydrate kinase family protein [Puniceicoccales bacterium]